MSDLSRITWQRKVKSYRSQRLAVVAPSKWLGNAARTSSLFASADVRVIPNALDTTAFTPMGRRAARSVLNLPPDGPIILVAGHLSSNDPRKGFDLLAAALARLPASRLDGLTLVAVGSDGDQGTIHWPCRVIDIGYLYDDVSLALLYSAANLLVAPSREDNLPNAVMEAMSCGTPCLAFDVGGLSDMILPGKNGYLAQPYDVSDMAQLMDKLLATAPSRSAVRQVALDNYSLPRQAKAVSALYSEQATKHGST